VDIKKQEKVLYIYVYIYIYTDTRRVLYYLQADVDTFPCANNRQRRV